MTPSAPARTARSPWSSSVGGESGPGLTAAIGKPATRGLAGKGIETYEQLTGFSESQLLEIHGVGPRAIGILREEMSKRGLRFSGE